MIEGRGGIRPSRREVSRGTDSRVNVPNVSALNLRTLGYGESDDKYTPLWDTRRQAEESLDGQLRSLADIVNETFMAIDHGIARLEELDQPFGRVSALVLIKARNLALGCYSLSLDALAQEGGALFRPRIECLELITYFRLDPTRINEALEDRLPKAGVIAQRIAGKLKGVRDYLNEHSSHLSLSADAMRHLVDFKSGRLRPVQTHNDAVLRGNLLVLLAVLIWLAIEAANCVGTVDGAFGETVEDIKRRAFVLFDQRS